MKTYLSLSLLSLLLACGETRIESVDEDVLEQAQSDKAVAALKREETALLGTWQACSEISETESTGHEYVFTGEGGVLLVQRHYAKPKCADEATEVDSLTATWKLVPVKDSSNYTLHFGWENGGKLESQYRFNSGSAELPKIFDLRSKPDLALVQLEDKDSFLTLQKVAVDIGAEQRKQSERMLMDFANGLLGRPGIWLSACSKKTRTTIQFEVSEKTSMKRTLETFEDDKCETVKESKTDEKPTEFKLVSVSDWGQKKISLEIGDKKEKGSLKVFFNNMDKLEFADKTGSMAYTFQVAGDEP